MKFCTFDRTNRTPFMITVRRLLDFDDFDLILYEPRAIYSSIGWMLDENPGERPRPDTTPFAASKKKKKKRINFSTPVMI
jgi:hypothetical protein